MKELDLISHIINKQDSMVIVWLFNIGTEKFWSGNTYGVADKRENVIVNHIEEMNLLLTREQDILILRKMPDLEFLENIKEFHGELPLILYPAIQNEEKSISELVLEDEQLLEQLKEINHNNEKVFLVPYGVSILEEKIASRCGFDIIGSSHDINKMINNKIFSRSIAEQLGYKVPEGFICNNIDDIIKAYEFLKKKYKKLIIKHPNGASGKGLWVVDDDQKMKTVLLILKRIIKNSSESNFIIEGWINKKTDLNYQVYVKKSGDVEIFSIKEQIVDETVYTGSFIPPRISDEICEECKKCGREIGSLLYNKGFNGILGIDAIITDENILIPIIEINARFTLSTYVSFIEQSYPNKKIFTFYIKCKTDQELNYSTVKRIMESEGLWLSNGEGTICYVSGTMDSKIADRNLRFFGLIIGQNEDYINQNYQKIQMVLQKFNRKQDITY